MSNAPDCVIQESDVRAILIEAYTLQSAKIESLKERLVAQYDAILAAIDDAKRYYPAHTTDGPRMLEVEEGQSVWIDADELLKSVSRYYPRKGAE